jgi:hypothetical protein
MFRSGKRMQFRNPRFPGTTLYWPDYAIFATTDNNRIALICAARSICYDPGSNPDYSASTPVDHRADRALRTGSGLDISLASLVEANSEPRLEVTLRNVGETPLWLCLGFLYGDQYPVNVHLILTEPSGEVVPLNLRIPVAVNGRVDPMIVPLSSPAAFVLPIRLAQYRPSTSYRSLDLEPGRYRLYAWYEGSCEITAQNPYPYPLWAGVLKSDETGFVLERKLPAPIE